MQFNYDLIPCMYRVGNHSEEKITLYRGDSINLKTGIKPRSERDKLSSKLIDIQSIVHSGDTDRIDELIDVHTSGSYDSGLVSATFDPSLAQIFAKNNSTTIYCLEIAASRLLLDANNIGKSGKSGEIFVLGDIRSSEIVGYKKENTPDHSELLYDDGNGTSWLRSRPLKDTLTREIRGRANWHFVLN